VHPFDLRAAFWAKHAQHIVLIHFPIALFIAGVAFDLLGQASHRQRWCAAAYYNFSLAALTTLPVLATGILAWQWALEGQRLKGVLLMHLVLGCVSSVLIWAVWVIHATTRRKQDAVLPTYRLPVEVVAVVLVAATAHLGGFLSGVNGPT
jgi:uncharacterized membrane protein